ncbi:heme/hemin ABC transporter substrate-binding protein [Pseudomonas sp. NPDC078416]|uniref:heme/hemin ABC transporter substrate-binding protein n=1 Tax=Pseudomonas sp. NPDC078416 TaxID=3390637 RepID=UPI003D05F074
MRFTSQLIAIVAGLFIAHLAAAASPEPQRWVSAGGALTEWIVALGGESRLMGVDSTSQHPPSVKSLPGIGYQRQLSAEGILTLRPKVLIGTEEMGPPPVIQQLRTAGVQVEVLSANAELPALRATLERLGALLGKEGEARQVGDQYIQRLAAEHERVTQLKRAAPGVLLLVSHAGSAPMVAGAGTVGDWLITQAGGRNLAIHTGYKVFSTEALSGLNPEVLVVSDRVQNGVQPREALLRENPVLGATAAVRDKRVIEIDPTLLVGGLGPRLPDAVKSLAEALYPDAAPLNARVSNAQ